jgi:hypothetical protein
MHILTTRPSFPCNIFFLRDEVCDISILIVHNTCKEQGGVLEEMTEHRLSSITSAELHNLPQQTGLSRKATICHHCHWILLQSTELIEDSNSLIEYRHKRKESRCQSFMEQASIIDIQQLSSLSQFPYVLSLVSIVSVASKQSQRKEQRRQQTKLEWRHQRLGHSIASAEKAQAKRGVCICRKMQRKQRNSLSLLLSFSFDFFLFFETAKSNQPTRKVEQFYQTSIQIANSQFDTLYSTNFPLFRLLVRSCWRPKKTQKSSTHAKTMSDNDARMAAASSSSPMSDINPQSPITSPPTTNNNHNHLNHTTNNTDINTTTSPTQQSLSANKRSRGRPRKYHTDAEREEAKRRYRENHKTKAASGVVSGGAGGAAGNTVSLTAAAAAAAGVATFPGLGVEGAKQSDVDELWEVVRVLQEEVRGLKEELAVQRDGGAAQPGQKRKKV